jgi:hypothetical protein
MEEHIIDDHSEENSQFLKERIEFLMEKWKSESDALRKLLEALSEDKPKEEHI